VLNRIARALFGRLFTPLAKLLVKLGISPDVITIIGTVGVCAGALAFFPRGEFFWGTMVITAFVFSDTLDGTMARLTQRPSRWGAFLDSSLDRLGDGAIFASLTWGLLQVEHNRVLAGVALYCLVVGGVVPYLKARAEALGATANVGIAERADRLVICLVAAGFHGLGVPYILAVALWVVAVASTITMVQRTRTVRQQILAVEGRRPTMREARAQAQAQLHGDQLTGVQECWTLPQNQADETRNEPSSEPTPTR
jgi:CDP-diacylglycerol--glycerol-3-phosphate 3-phosphatidyltransferase